MFAVAWALYSTEELAQLMEEPCGNPRKPETLPLEQACYLLTLTLTLTLTPTPTLTLTLTLTLTGDTASLT